MKLFLFFIFITTVLFGSTPSNNQHVKNINQKNLIQDDFDDEFDDEFIDETDETTIYDPLIKYNRAMTQFNDFVFIYILNPTAKGYSYVVPKALRKGISNAFHNIAFPIRFVNNVLQLKFQNAGEETSRFLINSTFGVFGLFDAAYYTFKLDEHNEDFGQTLGFYGVKSGPHIVLPFLGPSNLRDAFSLVPDNMLTLVYNSNLTYEESLYLNTFYYVNKTSLHLGEYESIKKDAIDFYPFIRDLYEQKRIKEIEE